MARFEIEIDNEHARILSELPRPNASDFMFVALDAIRTAWGYFRGQKITNADCRFTLASTAVFLLVALDARMGWGLKQHVFPAGRPPKAANSNRRGPRI